MYGSNLKIGTSVGRVRCPQRAAVWHECVQVCNDGAHGVTRPAFPKVAMNCYRNLEAAGRLNPERGSASSSRFTRQKVFGSSSYAFKNLAALRGTDPCSAD